MVTWGDVRRWEPGAVGEVADALGQRCTTLVGVNEDLHAVVKLDDWSGDAAVAARTRGGSLVSGLEQRVAEASAVRHAAHEAQVALDRITAYVRETDELAARNGLTIGTDGVIVLVPHTGPLSPDVAAAQARVRAELADRVEQILRHAADVDADFAAVLLRAMRGEITDQGVGTLAQAAEVGAGQGGLSVIGPPEHARPGEVKAWWDSLSDTAKGTILRDNPDLIRNLDGIPVVDRDAANRAVLKREIDRFRSDPSPEGQGKLRGLLEIDKRLRQPGAGQQQAFLMGLDTSGDGKVIVASGNPDTAANVATYVPGTGSDLANIGTDLGRSDKMLHAAEVSGSPSTAVVTWLGYDAPNGLGDAIGSSYAENATTSLQGFEEGMRATHQGPPAHSTVLGHSYGTTVVGLAAHNGGLNADELVFVASPGVGVDHASDLHLAGVAQADIGQHVHATVAQHDIINTANFELSDGAGPGEDRILGPDPTAKAFGGQTFTSAPGTAGPAYLGGYSEQAHSEYWEDRNPSLNNIGQVIAGKPTA
ncbi:alpha/beta hydrolase [Amycolatopsis sp. NPDC059027]|uniref:alpha/beta hydrolase n=1 Tax=Amycolatopsis sp. NPDC059027 TaxID=3346709 RepID=UPI00366C1D25